MSNKKSDGKNATLLRDLVREACLPASQEIGIILKDSVSYWKTKNRLRVLDKTADLLESYSLKTLPQANPRVLADALEHCGTSTDDSMQQKWAGLIASAFSGNSSEDHSVIYVNLLDQISSLQSIIIDSIVPEYKIYATDHGLIISEEKEFPLDELIRLCGCEDKNELDVAIDHLADLGMIKGGLSIRETKATITLRPLLLNLYARCKGWSGDIFEFYEIDKDEDILPPTKLETSMSGLDASLEEMKSSSARLGTSMKNLKDSNNNKIGLQQQEV